MTPKEKIKQAKEFFDLGIYTQEEFDVIKTQCLSEMGMTTSTPPVNKEETNNNVLGGNRGTIVNESMPNPLGGSDLLGGDAGTSVGLVSGIRVGDYEIVDILGEGGMGTVYRGRHHNKVFAEQGGDVAIKLMKPEYAQNPGFKERFLREAGIGRRIFHNNIAPCLGFVDDGRHLALVMGFVDGKELKDMIPEGGMEIEEVIQYIRPIALALDYLHNENIVHRDIKPENIKVNAKGNPIILDMGIAKDTNTSSGSTTKTSTRMGTLPYMAPEQFRDAKNVDGRADQYALGIMVYEMISGRFPWDEGTSEFDIGAMKAFDKLPKIREYRDVSEFIEDVLEKALSSKVEERFDSCRDFIEALASYQKREVAKYERNLQIQEERQRIKEMLRLEGEQQREEQRRELARQKEREEKTNREKERKEKERKEKERIEAEKKQAEEQRKAEEQRREEVEKQEEERKRNEERREEEYQVKEEEQIEKKGGGFKWLVMGLVLLGGGYFYVESEKQEKSLVDRQEQEKIENEIQSKVQRLEQARNEAKEKQREEQAKIEAERKAELEREEQARKDAEEKQREERKRIEGLMKKITAGSFTMGCTSEQGNDCFDSEKPSHKVRITRDYYIGKYEVTQRLYQEIMGENPSNFSSCGSDCPVENVSWYDAIAFLNKLSVRDGFEACYRGSGENITFVGLDCDGYRLPTEAEWEYAARGGQNFKYAGSDNVDAVSWYGDNSGNETHPVGQKKANGYELYDMSGNVWEWVWDGYGNYSSSNSQRDPLGDESSSHRVIRGGSWDNFARSTRVSYRNNYDPSNRNGYIGFRISRTLSSP